MKTSPRVHAATSPPPTDKRALHICNTLLSRRSLSPESFSRLYQSFAVDFFCSFGIRAFLVIPLASLKLFYNFLLLHCINCHVLYAPFSPNELSTFWILFFYLQHVISKFFIFSGNIKQTCRVKRSFPAILSLISSIFSCTFAFVA